MTRAIHILIIEDDDDFAEMLQTVLQESGHHVDVASTGQTGLRLAFLSPPDVVLCDIGLPGNISGFEVARALREDPGTRGAHLVALTGYGGSREQARTRDAGFDAHLTKPIDLQSLARIVGSARLGPPTA